MAFNAYVIFAEPGAWRVGFASNDGCATTRAEVAAARDAPPDEIADVVAAALRDIGYAGGGVVLAMASSECLCAAIRADGLPPKQRRRAMLYRLEEKLPVAAEDVVADFVSSGDGNDALGVCAAKRTLAPIVGALESRGVAVQAIVPAALLALQHRLPLLGGAGAVTWGAGGRVELFLLTPDGRPRAWYALPNEAKDLVLHLELEAMHGTAPRTLAALALPPAMRAAMAAARPSMAVVDGGDASLDDDATAAAAAVLAGRVEPWVDLRRDDLAATDRLRLVRLPLRLAVAAAVLCLACAGGAMLWRASQYGRRAAAYADEQRAVFRRVFPAQPQPPDVPSRLASEERALRATSGVGGDGGDASVGSAAPPAEASGLLALRDLLGRLPADLRFRVLELRLDDGRFTLEGQARSHGDADVIAEALRRDGAFAVEPPRTEQLAEPAGPGVAFTLTGAAVAAAPAPRAAGASAAAVARKGAP